MCHYIITLILQPGSYLIQTIFTIGGVCVQLIYCLDCCSAALAVLKKHYHALWRSFPDDHMITLTTLCGEFKVQDRAIEMITRCSTSEEANRTILDYIIFITNGDQQMNAFCNLMAKLINNPKLSRVVGGLRNGTSIFGFVQMYAVLKYMNVSTYMYIRMYVAVHIYSD